MTIRKATPSDAVPIATCLLLAMKGIVYKFIGERNPEKANAFMLHFTSGENNQYSWQNCWVAEDDIQVVAAVNVYDGGNLHTLRQPVIDYLRKSLNRFIKVEDETAAGEFYIDSLGVMPDQQGKGIGTKVLTLLIEEYMTRRRQTLGLLVDEENVAARKLYMKLGFKSAGAKVLLGKTMEHLQCVPQ